MYSRKEIKDDLKNALTDRAIDHIAYCISQTQDQILGIGDPYKGKFIECVVNKDWKRAESVADSMNKEVLTKTTIYQDWLKKIYKTPEYRELRLAQLLDNTTS